jgi:GR25 family glycosyltransferase involved in LPS biosynthesis
MFDLKNCHTKYINLAHRIDRRTHMIDELARVGLKAERFEAIRTVGAEWNRPPYLTMFNRTKGAIGCYLSQMEVLKEGLELKKDTLVMEDDLVFCSDFDKRIDYIANFLENKEWDIVWLGATFHADKAWWYNGSNPDMIPPTSSYFNSHSVGITTDFERTNDQRIMRTFGCFCTYAYIVRYESIAKVLDKLNFYMPISMGIDWSMIVMQPSLKTYTLVPGSVKQMDSISDIGTGITKFSGFSMLGKYWWTDTMDEFDPASFNFGEAKIN